MNELIQEAGLNINSYTYDGDTPANIRQKVRKAGHIVITNPDMLHSAILPHHTKWVSLFENLQYVIIDELHIYRGVFGSHVANVIRRLRRICQFYGSDPIFICTSATIANPLELAENLTEKRMHLIHNNGAPSGVKHFVFYNPPIVNKPLNIRRSATLEVRKLAGELLKNKIQTIVFARSRVRVEILLTYLKELVKYQLGPKAIRGYRGGYLPTERREIENGLRSGDIYGVVSTNALELGVDIGQLQVCIMTGYPGTIASTWQQAGRAGRRHSESLVIMVASSSPLDQYIIGHPDYFFRSSPETARINPDNLIIVIDHMKWRGPAMVTFRIGRAVRSTLLVLFSAGAVMVLTACQGFKSAGNSPSDTANAASQAAVSALRRLGIMILHSSAPLPAPSVAAICNSSSGNVRRAYPTINRVIGSARTHWTTPKPAMD
jgi:DEAD/DEAH box helicase domain-containing protein